MNSKLALTLTCMLAMATAACTDDHTDDSPKPIEDAGNGQSDGGAPDAASSDGGSADGGALALVDYVNDLVDHHTDSTSLPDDVAARTIVDNQDPTAFDSRFR